MDPNELAVCAGQLQSMALEKLEEFGLSREELQEMTDMISQDFLGLGGPARLTRLRSTSRFPPHPPPNGTPCPRLPPRSRSPRLMPRLRPRPPPMRLLRCMMTPAASAEALRRGRGTGRIRLRFRAVRL